MFVNFTKSLTKSIKKIKIVEKKSKKPFLFRMKWIYTVILQDVAVDTKTTLSIKSKQSI